MSSAWSGALTTPMLAPTRTGTPASVTGPAHQLVDPHRTVAGIVEGHAGEQGGELVPTEASQDVGGAQRGTDPLAQLLQQLVARVVAEAVVDRLEPVEVEQQERRGSTGAQLLAEPEHQRPPVRQAREVVGGGLPAHLVQRARSPGT